MDEHAEMKAIVDSRKTTEKEKKEASSNKRLCDIAQKKILTATIGALSSVEEYFGSLWAHGENRELTDEEQAYKDLFEKARSEILDKGNNQSRNVKAEFTQYTITWNRYSMTLPIKAAEFYPESEDE